MEAFEKGWQAALRELCEETALVPEDFWTTSFCETFYLAVADAVEIVPAFVARVATDAIPVLNDEHSALRWVTLEEAAELRAPVFSGAARCPVPCRETARAWAGHTTIRTKELFQRLAGWGLSA